MFTVRVLLQGLMLICIDGESSCPSPTVTPPSDFPHTAWVVKADGKSEPCGWKAPEVTMLEAAFAPGDYEVEPATACTLDLKDNLLHCPLSHEMICLDPDSITDEAITNLDRLVSIEEIDPRFVELRPARLNDQSFVSTRLHFKKGEISPGPRFKHSGSEVFWKRSYDPGGPSANPARPLSERLRIHYRKVSELRFTNCQGQELLRLTPKAEDKAVFIRNFTDVFIAGDRLCPHTNLPYLLWYYPLARWNTQDEECPEYSTSCRDAVVLRCTDRGSDTCHIDSATVFWPPMLGPTP